MLISFLITILVARSEFMAPFDLRLKYGGWGQGLACELLPGTELWGICVLCTCSYCRVVWVFLLIDGLWSNVASSLYLWLQSTFFRNVGAFLHTSVKSTTAKQNHLGNEFSVCSVISSEFLAFLCILREEDVALSSASFVCGQTLERNNSWGGRKWQRSPLHMDQCLSVFQRDCSVPLLDLVG